MQQVVVAAIVDVTPDLVDLLSGEPVVVVGPDAIEELWDGIDENATHVLLIGERRHEAQVRRHAALLTDRGTAVAWCLLPHGPAALVLLALQVAGVRLDAGALPSLLGDLAESTWSGAWTPSVARLADPAPSLGQHMRSLLPSGGGFVVTLAGDAGPGVVPVGSAAQAAVMSRHALYRAGGEVPPPALDHLHRVTGTTDTVELPGLRLDPDRFGAPRAVELVALPHSHDVPLPRTEDAERCTICAAAVLDAFCPYCHVRPAGRTDLTGGQS